MRDLLSGSLAWLQWLLTNHVAVLALGGAAGTNARYYLGRWLNEATWTRGFPLGTFVINVSGSFLLGLIAVVIQERLPPHHQNWYLLLGTGFCGGYTTFSTFEWETYKLLQDGSWWLAVANVLGSVLAGLAAAFLAVIVLNVLFPRPS